MYVEEPPYSIGYYYCTSILSLCICVELQVFVCASVLYVLYGNLVNLVILLMTLCHFVDDFVILLMTLCHFGDDFVSFYSLCHFVAVRYHLWMVGLLLRFKVSLCSLV